MIARVWKFYDDLNHTSLTALAAIKHANAMHCRRDSACSCSSRLLGVCNSEMEEAVPTYTQRYLTQYLWSSLEL